MKYADVYVPIKSFQKFTYIIPTELVDYVKPGIRVIVPFNRIYYTGVVEEIFDEYSGENRLKRIIDIVDDNELTDVQSKMADWISRYYIAPKGLTYKLFFPAGSDYKFEHVLFLGDNFSELPEKIQTYFADNDKVTLNEFKKNFPDININKFLKNNLLLKTILPKDPTVKEKIDEVISLIDNDWREKIRKNAKLQYQIMEYIEEFRSIKYSDLLKNTKINRPILSSLFSKNLISIEKIEDMRVPELDSDEFVKDFSLSDEQQQIYEKLAEDIESESFAPSLLYGVTGSGKTLIYIELIRKAITKDKRVIFLLPEIAITFQIAARLKYIFGEEVIFWHSNLSENERYDVWRQLINNRYKIVVGARSAIFLPVENVGLIIVDEEHDGAYKNNEFPYYNGRDLAVYRAMLENASIVLGTATPSMETYYNAVKGKYKFLYLLHRYKNVHLPSVKIIDMTEEKSLIFSEFLDKKIREKLEKTEQIILLLNQRGSYNTVYCKNCHSAVKCPNCSVSLTLHHKNKSLKCHYCDYSVEFFDVCPVCGKNTFFFSGVGTEKFEEIVQKNYPAARVLRMDSDTTRKKNEHGKIIRSFKEQEADILVGTQMVSKGLDFGNVSLVGVISIDLLLNLPDFRAPERAFQLLTQVAGRSGRREKKGEVVIQTFFPEHYCVISSKNHSIKGFMQIEMENRKELNYPPFSRIIRILAEGNNENRLKYLLNKLKREISQKIKEDMHILGPVSAVIEKINRNFRYHIIIKHNSPLVLNEKIRKIIENLNPQEFSQIKIDVDPLHLM